MNPISSRLQALRTFTARIHTIIGVTQVKKIFYKSIFYKGPGGSRQNKPPSGVISSTLGARPQPEKKEEKAQTKEGKISLPVALSVAHWERGRKQRPTRKQAHIITPQRYSTMTNWWGKVEMKIATPGSSSTPDGVGFKTATARTKKTGTRQRCQVREVGHRRSTSRQEFSFSQIVISIYTHIFIG